MIGQLRVAIFARVIRPATLHLDRNNIRWTVEVFAASLCIEVHAADFDHPTRFEGTPLID